MATDSVPSISKADKLKQMLQTVTGAVLFIEQILGAIAPAGGVDEFDAATTEGLTTAFGNLATIAVQAAHDVAGKQITPESVMELMPVSTPLQAAVEG